MSVEVNFSELDVFNMECARMINTYYPQEAKKFLNDMGNKGKRVLRAHTKSKTKKHTGNLLKGIDKSTPHIFEGNWQIRVRNNAPHAELVEHGHKNEKKKGSGKIKAGTPIVMVPGREGPLFIGKDDGELTIPGKHPAAEAQKQLKAEYMSEVDRWVDDMLNRGFG